LSDDCHDVHEEIIATYLLANITFEFFRSGVLELFTPDCQCRVTDAAGENDLFQVVEIMN
jgi:hypothetical protein